MNLKDIQTFIFVHDQKIIKSYEDSNKFSNIGDYKYVFLGSGDIDMLTTYNNIIIARDLNFNIENHTKMCAYSGWYVLYKNKLVTSKIVNLFEYDIVLSNDYIIKLTKTIKNDIDFYGYKPLSIDINFLDNPNWSGKLNEYFTDLQRKVKNKCIGKEIELWSTTSNVTMTNDFFYKYMSDSEELFFWMKEFDSAGHELERYLSVYQILKNSNVKYIENVLTHYQLDSHKTQGIFRSDNDEIIKQIS